MKSYDGSTIDATPELRDNSKTSLWTEFKNPDGRPCYYNSVSKESKWEKKLVYALLLLIIGSKLIEEKSR
ncbi:unnamed protein product [Didymodactylos carnosus]|uniref:WW domain-containing protein n=1 Tax=Didymodactylos carnosus TaxID=1234261 RepID=A0A8S2EJH4_9BILA|nr:unnamed protein product [Didymodactylos carnosus]CAF3991082.1 unnamed protein product [Didymodactylos carnosus]